MLTRCYCIHGAVNLRARAPPRRHTKLRSKGRAARFDAIFMRHPASVVVVVTCGGGAACVARHGVQLRGAIQCVMFNYSGTSERASEAAERFSNLHPINRILILCLLETSKHSNQQSCT